MHQSLLSEIETYLAETGLGDHRFGIKAARNGRLLERLRSGRRVWPETEIKVRMFMALERERRRSITEVSA